MFVRLGLRGVRILVGVKAMVFRMARLLAVIIRPIIKWIAMLVFVPLYRVLFASRRRIHAWYRPAKSRVMFFLTNRAVMHITMAGVVAGTVGIHVSMGSVRAETLDAFQKSLAYAIITQEDSIIIEEYADTDSVAFRAGTAEYLSQGVLSPSFVSDDVTTIRNTTSLAGGGALATSVIAQASDSVAPRDGVETYVVAEGDALSTIAARFGISVNTILWANALSSHSVLRPGQSLTILPASGVLVTVKNGDTLTKIAKTYGAESSVILEANKLADASAIAVGQKLVIPGGTPPAVVAIAKPSASTVRSVFVPAPSGSTGTKTSASARMVWPSEGHGVVRGLSWYHTGVDIDCDGHANGTSTQDNFAAADGVVTFAGPHFVGPHGGFGNLVVISHGNGLETRYGHNYSVYVKKGDVVTAGQPIARCGSTGWSSGTHLHFEVIGPGGAKDYRNPFEYIR
jgi:murein DD-endopeptidase MepM/ murein hydrolase activator NlpD